MARPKKSETVVEEAIAAEPIADAVVEEKPKRTRKKKTDEPKVEEVKVEEASTEEKKAAENSTKVTAAAEPKKCDSSYTAQIISANGAYTFANPTLDAPKGKILSRNTRVVIIEVKGNWGKISEGKWILLGNTAKI